MYRRRRIIFWTLKKKKHAILAGIYSRNPRLIYAIPDVRRVSRPKSRRCWAVLVIFNINPLAKFSYSCLISLGLGLGVVTSDSTRTSPVIHIDDEPRPHQLQRIPMRSGRRECSAGGPPEISLKPDTLLQCRILFKAATLHH